MIFCYEPPFNMHNMQILLVDEKSSTKQENKLSMHLVLVANIIKE